MPAESAAWSGWVTLPVLGAAAFLAGLVDSIAGGGGLITVPALLAAGVSPKVALGTNKLQSSFGSGTAMVSYARGGVVRLRPLVGAVVVVFVAAAGGSLAVQHLSNDLLRAIIPFLLLGLLVYVLLRPRLGLQPSEAKLSRPLFWAVFGVAIGFYDGFFGPGTGSFWTMALVVMLGMDLRSAVGHTKVMNFTSNIAALALFAWGGYVRADLGLVMAAGQFFGARLGSKLVLRRGARFIRPVLLVVVALTTAKLIWDWLGR